MLEGGGDRLLREATIGLSREAMALRGWDSARAEAALEAALADGTALDAWRRMVVAHGGDPDLGRLDQPVASVAVAADGDGFVDVPYLIYDFYGVQIGQDDLPWTYADRWFSAAAKEATEVLVGQVQALGLPKGFYGKLNDAIKVLGDANPNNDSAAINKLNDFIDQVSNNQDAVISAGGDPAALIAEAQAIIAILETG